jgi:Zn-dependent protease with chaperone function
VSISAELQLDRSSVVTDPADPPAASAVLAQLDGHIEPVPISPVYRLGLILVAVVMILLPVIYVGLIALVGYGVYLHATNDTFLLHGGGGRRSSGGSRGALLAYLGPLVTGGILLLFMIKPLFARRGKASNLKTLERAREPLLFEFVDRLCDVVGSRRPRRINVDCQVNASAGFSGGLLSLFGHNLVLTIGLPLAAGLNLRQLTGVLAHEFGHFAQGTAMRVSYIVRSINMWFARVVYERDRWDEQLDRWASDSGSAGIAIVLWVSKLMVWLTRRVLWALMQVGHAVSCFLLRQMEFDADRYEARVSGSDAFEQTARLLPQLSVASNGAFADLSQAWSERRLCDDLPALILHNAKDMSDEVRKKVEALVAEKKTGWFDTHPADADRIASARRENAPGLFTAEMPATVLFSDFPALCRETSQAFYRETLGPKFEQAALVPTDALHSAQAGQIESHKAMRRVFQGKLTPTCPVFVSAAPPILSNADALAERLIAARSRMADVLATMGGAVERIEKADGELMHARNARTLLSAGFKKVRPEEFGLTRGDAVGVSEALTQAQAARQTACEPFAGLESAAADRLETAAALARSQKLAGAIPDEDLARLDGVLATLDTFRSAFPAVIQLRDQYVALATLLKRIEGNRENESLINGIRSGSAGLIEQLRAVRGAFGTTAYPFDHATRGISLADFVVDAVPTNADEIGAVYGAADSALDRAFGVYFRAISFLSLVAERVESALGLPPAADPPEKAENEGSVGD